MMKYEILLDQLRDPIRLGFCTKSDAVLITEAANAIEELLKAAKAMHTWIFLNTGDEQKAYDECGLSDEMNAALDYVDQFVAELLKEETDGN